MRNTLKLGIAGLTLFIGSNLLAQTSTKEKPAQKSEPAQSQTKQEPTKKENKAVKKDAKQSQAAKSGSDSTGTQKMAITEQGINKNKKKQKAVKIDSTATPPPADQK